MKIKGKIMQFIAWEDKEKYFFGMIYGDKPVDLLHIGVTEEDSKWHDRGVIGFTKSFLKLDKPVFDYENIVFHQGISGGVSYDGLPILVERPHKFKLGDEVEIEINVSIKK